MDSKRRTALLYAARYGRTFAASRLLDARANIGFADRAAWHFAGFSHAFYRFFHVFSHVFVELWAFLSLFLKGFGAFWCEFMARVAEDGQVPLFAAACNEHLDAVDLLLRAGANINATDQRRP